MNYQLRAGRLLMRIRPAPLASLLKRVLFIRRQVLDTPEGRFWIDPASYLGSTLGRQGAYEPHTLAAIKALLRPGDTFVDVGANEGYFTVAASRCVGPAGRVVAVEPQQRALEALKRNLELNDCRNVSVHEVALSDAPGKAMLHLTPDMNNSASGLSVSTRYPLPVQEITCVTLAQLLTDAGVPDGAVAKFDIEGWEYEAILGSPAVLRSGCIRALLLEMHPHLILPRGLVPGRVTDFLAECGYRCTDGQVWTRDDTG